MTASAAAIAQPPERGCVARGPAAAFGPLTHFEIHIDRFFSVERAASENVTDADHMKVESWIGRAQTAVGHMLKPIGKAK